MVRSGMDTRGGRGFGGRSYKVCVEGQVRAEVHRGSPGMCLVGWGLWANRAQQEPMPCARAHPCLCRHLSPTRLEAGSARKLSSSLSRGFK